MSAEVKKRGTSRERAGHGDRNRNSARRAGGSAQRRPLSAGDLWRIARGQIFTWNLVFLLGLAPTVFLMQSAGTELREPKGLFFIALMSISTGLAPWSNAWAFHRYRALSLSTPEIRIVNYMVLLPCIAFAQAAMWLGALIIGLESQNAWIYIAVTSVIHVIAVLVDYLRIRPEHTEVISDGDSDQAAADGATTRLTRVDDPLRPILRQSVRSGAAWSLGTVMVMLLIGVIWWLIDSESLFTTVGIVVCIGLIWVIYGVGNGLAVSLQTWLLFSGSRRQWFREMLKETIPWAASGMVVLFVAGVLAVVGQAWGKELGLDATRTGLEMLLIFVVAGLALGAMVLATSYLVATGLVIFNGWAKWIVVIASAMCAGLIVAIIGSALVWQLKTTDNGDFLLYTAGMVVASVLILAAGAGVMRMFLMRMDCSAESLEDNLGLK